MIIVMMKRLIAVIIHPNLLFAAIWARIGGYLPDSKFDWYDINLNHLPVKSVGYENSKTNKPEVKNFDSMVRIAKVLSEGMPHVRIDLYSVNGKIYFGEYTFFHDASMVPIEPLEWDYKFGELMKLPSKYVK